jgi:hypothetical protein
VQNFEELHVFDRKNFEELRFFRQKNFEELQKRGILARFFEEATHVF